MTNCLQSPRFFWNEALPAQTSLPHTVTILIFREGTEVVVRETNNGKLTIVQTALNEGPSAEIQP